LVNVLRANVDGLFKDLISLTDIDSLAAAGKLFDDNKNLVSSNRKHKKVNGTDALKKLRPQAVELLNDIRTLCEGNLEPDSSVLNGLLLASEIPEFGIRHTNAEVLVVKEGNVSLGKKVVATDLTSTSKKKKSYKSNADSVVAITEHMPGKALFRFEAEGCEALEVEITFEKGKTVKVTVVLKGV
jgi:hypothetical protein